jgi:hypothetical protein
LFPIVPLEQDAGLKADAIPSQFAKKQALTVRKNLV